MMNSKKVHVKSFGCQMNKLDTALAAESLRQAGYELTDKAKQADVVLINTCSVRQGAEQRVLSHLGHLRHIKENRPDIIVAVIGCMAQRLGGQLFENSAVDIVCGPAQIPQISKLINDTLYKRRKILSVTENIRATSGENPALEEFETVCDGSERDIPAQAFVRVMRGCDKFCTYCVVPYVRGPEISRPPEKIIEQIKRLAGQGIKQVTLLGQTVNSYEYKAGDRTWCLADILDMAGNVEGIEWIRFVTSYPTEKFFEPILNAMADIPEVCRHLHMPAQSGSDKILKKMKRKYTAENYLALIDKARDIVPDIAIASDFIVGFPTETDGDFQQTVQLVRKAKFKNSFIFKYSPRPGTIGDRRLKDDVLQEVKKQRNIELLAVQEKISAALAEKHRGRGVKVLVEGRSKRAHLKLGKSDNRPQLVGRTEQDWIVVFNGSENLSGNFADVEIEKTSPFTLFGRLSGYSNSCDSELGKQ